MDFLSRVRQAWEVMRGRGLVMGGAAMSQFDQAFGHDKSTFSPEEYGDYIATSNAIYTCATLRADTLASIRLKAFMERGAKRVEVVQSPVLSLLRKVNPFWTMKRLINMTELSLCLWGEAYWAVERGGSTQEAPREIWWLKPTQVRVFPDAEKYIRGYEFAPGNGAKPIWFGAHEVVWFRYPNPLDEFSGLSPLAAARLAADTGKAAARSNQLLFNQGYLTGGVIMPKENMVWSKEQAAELEASMDQRLKGIDKAHRWAVLRAMVEMKQMNVTPKDAEFLGTLSWSLEEAARAYHIPLDIIGGQRTYENVRAAERAFIYRTIMPEGNFIADELVEQFLPMFGPDRGGVSVIEHDWKRVPILQDEESERWKRANEQITRGAITVNEWRSSEGLEPVAWGEAWWAPMTLAPVKDGNAPAPTPSQAPAEGGGEEEEEIATASAKPRNDRGVEYGSEEHGALWRRFARRTEKQEREFGKAVVGLLERMQESVLARLKDSAKEGIASPQAARNDRTVEEAALDPFSRGEWIKKFREMARKALKVIITEAGEEALAEIGLAIAFDVLEPRVVRFLERRAQRFAREVCETTWRQLKEALGEGMEAGEGIPELSDRVRAVMAERIRSAPETIARTEVIGAANGGTLEAWVQSDAVEGKEWLTALDGRERESHREAHGQVVGIMDDFSVGGGSGPAPGQIGVAAEDINCRCTMTAVLKERAAKPGGNGG